MPLRYRGACRLCGSNLPAGTDAVYERATRSVRCLACSQSDGASVVDALAPAPAPVGTQTPVALLGLADYLAARAPASAVIAETLRVQSVAPSRTWSAKLFGTSPLSRDALPWYLGAIGELEVGAVLNYLGPGWRVIHSIPVGTRGSDVDHLVIGPGGVFTINTKHHERGQVWVASRRLMVNGQRTEHLRNSEHEANRVSRLLGAATQSDVDVTPLVVVVAARSITMRERPPRVVVLESTQLVRWLQSKPMTLDDERLQVLFAAATRQETWGTTGPAVPDLSAFMALRDAVHRARSRRRAWAAVGIIAFVTAPLLAITGAQALLAFASAILAP